MATANATTTQMGLATKLSRTFILAVILRVIDDFGEQRQLSPPPVIGAGTAPGGDYRPMET